MRANPNISSDSVSPVLVLKDHKLFPQASGALWWPSRKTLIVSDLHFEKGSSFAIRGQNLPPYDTRTTLQILVGLINWFSPETIISLGDSFHDPRAADRLDAADVATLRHMTSQCDWIWVEGNHDPDPPQSVGGRAAKELQIGRLIFRHEPTGTSGEVAGHLHPCARLAGRGGKLVRRRCFVTDGEALILPSMGAFTGGLNILDPAYNGLIGTKRQVFMSGSDRVFAVQDSKLVPDRQNHWQWRL